MFRDIPVVKRGARLRKIRLVLTSSIFHWVAGCGLLALDLPAFASTIYLPNASFEEPGTVFVDTNIVSWQKSPKPVWYDESANGPWDQLTGVFLNTPLTNSDHLANCDGAQAAFLFALPGVALFQDTASSSGRFQVGRKYDLTVGVLGNGGGMSNGVTLSLGFYYRDASNNVVTVASTTVTNNATLFPDRNHLVDFTVHLPGVAASDPWAGKPIGVQLLSSVDFTLVGGYWDLDNVRVIESIAVPNFSFESPATVFVDTNIDYWAKSPKPIWYDESANGPWNQLTGVFLNTPPDNTNNDHIVNCDGAQAAFLFALPGVALFQDNITSTNAFDIKFEPGTAYQLSVGVLGNGGNMTNGVTLELDFYYRDSASNMVPIASTIVTNSNSLFPSRTNLVDFQLHLPVVKATDPWSGKNLGIQIVSTVDFALAGGYWDIDNVRLDAGQANPQIPVLSGSMGTNGFNLTLSSEPGLNFELLATTNVTLALSNWTSIATLTNTTGSVTFTDTASGLAQRFYQGRPLP